MSQKKNPAAVATAAGAQGIAVSKNTATIARTGGKANRPAITSIRRRPYGKAAWLVSIEGVCADTPVRDRKLRRYRRFCNAINYRFGVTFDPMPQVDWLAMVEAAMAEGGVS
ncbi:hypothetical protein [Bradyrhizobium sp. PRIMUS42]|uniref:hypothetical protein n=1 Tax=Bradyrhizobium sp. PRIMUS42 TaxID=2908926 RepID=UPI001FF6C88F|nr:hypothetical protein [Bradyrhizobium sp. PRIMUS42]MCJ9728986.1 hypothetical protein [Bradyrhizobium sp. PRIMUS42]